MALRDRINIENIFRVALVGVAAYVGIPDIVGVFDAVQEEVQKEEASPDDFSWRFSIERRLKDLESLPGHDHKD